MNRVLLALISFALGGAVVWVARPRASKSEPVPSLTQGPLVVSESPKISDPVGPTDAEAANPPTAEMVEAGPPRSELEKLIEKMNWCGTGAPGAGDRPIVVPPHPRGPGHPTIPVRRTADQPVERLLSDLANSYEPSQHTKLIRAFLVEQDKHAPATRFAAYINELKTSERYGEPRDRLERAAAALNRGEPWERAFDEAPSAGKAEPTPSPKNH